MLLIARIATNVLRHNRKYYTSRRNRKYYTSRHNILHYLTVINIEMFSRILEQSLMGKIPITFLWVTKEKIIASIAWQILYFKFLNHILFMAIGIQVFILQVLSWHTKETRNT